MRDYFIKLKWNIGVMIATAIILMVSFTSACYGESEDRYKGIPSPNPAVIIVLDTHTGLVFYTYLKDLKKDKVIDVVRRLHLNLEPMKDITKKGK